MYFNVNINMSFKIKNCIFWLVNCTHIKMHGATIKKLICIIPVNIEYCVTLFGLSILKVIMQSQNRVFRFIRFFKCVLCYSAICQSNCERMSRDVF